MNTTILPRLAERVIGRPLLVTPSLAEIIYGVMDGRTPVSLSGTPPAPDASRFVGEHQFRNGRPTLNRFEGRTAIITIDGPLVNRGAWIGNDMCTGLVSYEGLAAQVLEAGSDPDVDFIVLDINSGGGEANGMFQLAALIRRERQGKGIIAVVNDLAASAAYGIASAADRIVVSPTSIVGSIGVVILHMDRSSQLARQGLKPTLIYEGANKVDGNPFGPLPDSVRAGLQREAATFYDRFIETVAEGRGRRLSAAAARATEAATYIGGAAVKAGLADDIGTLDDVLAALAARSARSSKSKKGL